MAAAAEVQALLDRARDSHEDAAMLREYRFGRLLGEGGMGAVCSLEHETSRETIAIKLIRTRGKGDPKAEQLFVREIANLTPLVHENIVRAFGAGSSGGSIFLLMEYCDGGSLLDLLRDAGGKLAVDESLGIIRQVLAGLDYGHRAQLPDVQLADGTRQASEGLVHRDLKPQNVFFAVADGERVAKVGDFGLAKPFLLAGQSGITQTGDAWGTPQFMPRQQVEDFKYVGPEVDVWAAAACLYFMLTGSTPRDFPKDKDPWSVVVTTKPVAIRQRSQTVSATLADLLDRALDDSDELHFNSVAAFQSQLDALPG